ncbi:hypothetical protein B0T19DRAFT_438059 [Cercophora scortea]|uniref:Pre-mRNA splicing factor CLF1 n=1 Tax=Cercophora scortea TaxID=314031 RepID=A0AAE0J5N3_9PEZI|nr:hypothetical protein B0T19DRAFT_438059 [Cercophora scortea]
MTLPEPKVPLTDACSVIFNDTLYTYSADAFQSLPLTAGAEWKQLPQGEKVTGGVCVGATTGEDSTSAFFVVGGKGSSADYQGMQKFTYSTGKWESIPLPKPVTQDRIGHGATYINSTDSIFVYAGSQEGSRVPSSQTFTIGASAPHLIHAFDSIAPPALDPILLPWSTSEVVLIGGSASNKNVMLFSSERAWFDSGASLAAPLEKDTSAVKAAIMTGADGSKHLYTFDMTLSPNSVQRTVLFNGTGVPVQNAVPITKRGYAEEVEARAEGVFRAERRDDGAPLTLANWPAYNSTLAPTSTRGNYALATDPNGLVVVAGGSTDDVLCMFNTRENGWQNATALLSKLKILSTESSTTLSSSSFSSTTSTSSPTSASTSLPVSATTEAVAATTTAAASAAPAKYSGPETNTILAAVLGSIFGLAVVLFGLYCCLQRKRRQQAHLEAGHTRRASGIASAEKNGIGMSSDSLHSGHGGTGTFRGHQTQESAGSFSSMAILMGRINQQKPGHSAPGRNLSYSSKHTKNSSADSTFRAFKSTISKPIPQETQPVMLSVPRSPRPDTRDEKGVSFAANTVEPKPRNPAVAAAIDAEGSTRRSSGWNRYWSGGSVSLFGLGGSGNGNGNGNNNNNGNGNGNSNTNLSSKRETVDSDRSSHYSNPNRMTQDSATVPPLRYNVNEPRASFSRVNTQSPTIAQYDKKMVMEGMSGQIETQRPVSGVSSVSGYSSGIPASVTENWDPTEASIPWGANRGPSTAYSASIYTTYSTPLAPATHNSRAPPPPPPVPRDDMSWLNLGDNGR